MKRRHVSARHGHLQGIYQILKELHILHEYKQMLSAVTIYLEVFSCVECIVMNCCYSKRVVLVIEPHRSVLMRSRRCRCVCVTYPPMNQSLRNLVCTAQLLSPSQQLSSACVCIYFARQRLLKNVTAATNTLTIMEKLLVVCFCI